LGATTLTKDSLSLYEDQLKSIGEHLSPDGDLLFYGCNIAEGENGRAFIEQIAALTGADVAASTDLTGNAALGGDWVLEAQAGSIEAQSLSIDSFASVFATYSATIQQNQDNGTIRYDLENYFNVGTFTLPVSQVLIVSEDSTPSGVALLFQVVDGNRDGSGQLQTDGWYTLSQVQHVLSNGSATDGGPLDWSVGSSEVQLKVAINVDWNTADLSGTYEFVFAGSRDFAIAINKAAPPNDPPTVTNPTISVNQGETASASLGADTNLASVSIGPSQYGTLGATGASYNFTANTTASFKGLKTETVNYSLTDSGDPALTTNGTVTINVTYIDDAPTGSVTATGTSKVDQLLTATDTISDVDDGGAGVSKTYQWQAFNTTNNTWEAIGGATNSTFTPDASSENKLVRVKITAGSPATDFYSDIRLIAPENGDPGVINITGLTTPITVKNPSGDTTITNNDPNPSTIGVTLDGPGGGTTVTTLGNGPITVANPARRHHRHQ
jgi:hypothetical protein